MLTINANHIKKAQELVNQNGYEPVDIRAKYSGRSMFGDECFGVVSSAVYLQEFENTLALLHVTDGYLGTEVIAYDVLDALVEIQSSRREDQMGYSRIYYYPGIKVEGELEDTEYESEYYG